MANNENLVSLATRPQQERSEIARMGQKASTEAKKQKATMRQVLLDMLNEVPKENNPRGLSYQQMATLGLIKGAVKGNAQNYKTMVETLGEINIGDENKSSGVINDLIEALSNAKRDK